jgi:hypothetical protein
MAKSADKPQNEEGFIEVESLRNDEKIEAMTIAELEQETDRHAKSALSAAVKNSPGRGLGDQNVKAAAQNLDFLLSLKHSRDSVNFNDSFIAEGLSDDDSSKERPQAQVAADEVAYKQKLEAYLKAVQPTDIDSITTPSQDLKVARDSKVDAQSVAKIADALGIDSKAEYPPSKEVAKEIEKASPKPSLWQRFKNLFSSKPKEGETSASLNQEIASPKAPLTPNPQPPAQGTMQAQPSLEGFEVVDLTPQEKIEALQAMSIFELEKAAIEQATTLLAKSIKEQSYGSLQKVDQLLKTNSVMYAAKDMDALLELKTQRAFGAIVEEKYKAKLADALEKLNSESHNAGTLLSSQPIEMTGDYNPLDRHKASETTQALIDQIAKEQQKERAEAKSRPAASKVSAMIAANPPSKEGKPAPLTTPLNTQRQNGDQQNR